MADSMMTIAGLIADKLNLSPTQTSNLEKAAPLVARLEAVPSSNGVTHLYPVETGAPVVGFRAPNEGRFFSKSADTLVTITLKILDWSFNVDKAVADSWMRGGADGFLQREGARHVRSAASLFERQILNGITDGDAAGFTGMADVLNDPDSQMVVDANASSTGGDLTSVYAICLGEDDVQGVYRGDGEPIDVADAVISNYVDANGKNLPCYYTAACSYLALQVGGAFSFGRIVNIGSGNNEGLNDDLIAELISRFPSDRQPNLLVMNRRSLFQLRASRTATNATGAPAPIPTESFGIELVSTESISSEESVVD